jgi:hypothetical protein
MTLHTERILIVISPCPGQELQYLGISLHKRIRELLRGRECPPQINDFENAIVTNLPRDKL